MKRSKWCKYCSNDRSKIDICQNKLKNNACLSRSAFLDNDLSEQMQSYRDWLAKWIKDCRKYKTQVSWIQLSLLRLCAKRLRRK